MLDSNSIIPRAREGRSTTYVPHNLESHHITLHDFVRGETDNLLHMDVGKRFNEWLHLQIKHQAKDGVACCRGKGNMRGLLGRYAPARQNDCHAGCIYYSSVYTKVVELYWKAAGL